MSSTHYRQYAHIVVFLAILSCPKLVFGADEAKDVGPEQLVIAALERTRHEVQYDGRYVAIDYPNGDVPDNIGVCTDVLIRSYRQLGIDLQKLVHEDMRANFSTYPNKWGLKRPDRNIDHRRVPNLQNFFTRMGHSFPLTADPGAYLAGDIVTWMLPGNLPHIGIVVTDKSQDGERPLIVHNVGNGPEKSDFLFAYPITGHYRYYPDNLDQQISRSDLE